MTRHMVVTTMIVFSIYLGLLFIIGHPFVAEAQAPAASHGIQSMVDKVQATDQGSTAITESSVAFSDGLTLVGVSSTVNLNNAETDINLLWQRLMENRALINNVDWSKDGLMAYSYYQDFDSDMNQATLTIGFDYRDLKLSSDVAKVVLPKGKAEVFSIDSSSDTASDEAWAKAYLYNNLIERHMLDQYGDVVSTDVIVVTR